MQGRKEKVFTSRNDTFRGTQSFYCRNQNAQSSIDTQIQCQMKSLKQAVWLKKT